MNGVSFGRRRPLDAESVLEADRRGETALTDIELIPNIGMN